MPEKQVIGEPIVINGHRLSLSRWIRAGDFVYLTGQVPMKDGAFVKGKLGDGMSVEDGAAAARELGSGAERPVDVGQAVLEQDVVRR